MPKNWPAFDSEDLPEFLQYLEEQKVKDEQIVQFKITNKSMVNHIINEPIGSGDDFPQGSTYQIVALVKEAAVDLSIELDGENVIIWSRGEVAIFQDNGAATLAY